MDEPRASLRAESLAYLGLRRLSRGVDQVVLLGECERLRHLLYRCRMPAIQGTKPPGSKFSGREARSSV